MKSLEEMMKAGPVLTDGAWGTELQKLGLGLGEFPDAWNLDCPDRVEAVARSYVEAGSRIILTNTFGANRIRLNETAPELAAKVVEINRRGVEISKQAAGQRAAVFASIGPSGRMLINGDVGVEELGHAFLEQARALAEAGADALVVETMIDVNEAVAAVSAAKQTGLPVVACMVFDSGRDRDRTLMGITPEEAARALIEAGADSIGSNCGQGIEGFARICRRLGAASGGRPVWIKANAGLPELVEGRAIYKATADGFVRHLPTLLEAGVGFIGGCCGTDPSFVRALADGLVKPQPEEAGGLKSGKEAY